MLRALVETVDVMHGECRSGSWKLQGGLKSKSSITGTRSARDELSAAWTGPRRGPVSWKTRRGKLPRLRSRNKGGQKGGNRKWDRASKKRVTGSAGVTHLHRAPAGGEGRGGRNIRGEPG